MGEKRDIWTRIIELDRRFIYIVLIFAIIFPLLVPIGVPIPISAMSRKFYETVEALPKGAVVGVALDVGVATWAELGGQVIAFTKHVMRKEVKVVVWSSSPEGVMVAAQYLPKIFEAGGYKLGTDYAILSYVAGGESGIVALAQDFQATLKKDYYGSSLSELPITKNIKDAKDFNLIAIFEGGTQTYFYAYHWVMPFGTEIITGATAACWSNFVPFLTVPVGDSYMLLGLLPALRGGGEYELLTGFKGKSVAMNDMLSITHLTILTMIVLVNISYFAKRKEVKKR